MKDAENKNYSRDLVLRVSPSRNAFVVEEHKPGGMPMVTARDIRPAVYPTKLFISRSTTRSRQSG